MKIQELFDKDRNLSADQIDILQHSCSHFFTLTKNPLLKNLYGKEDDFLRVKIRFHKRTNDFITVFNEALSQEYNIPHLHQRSIFTNGLTSFVPVDESSAYYVFPINGFKFLYNPQVKSANSEYRNTFEVLMENFNDITQVTSIIKDLISQGYVAEDLNKGIVEGCEIILYNIPYYYAVKVSAFPEYKNLLNLLEK